MVSSLRLLCLCSSVDRVAPRAGSFDHVSFSSSGLAAFEARLRACNVVYRRDAVPATGQVQLFMQDPSGNGVELTFVESDDV
jgi:hypothetical protein